VQRRSTIWLHLLVFVGGAGSLATEMAGARLLAPYFGASNIVWANVIGLILLYLSVGYWLGGKLADRHPNERSLAIVVLVAGGSVALLPFVTKPLFAAAGDAFADLSAGAFIGSFLGTMLMFAIPVTALGAVTPWAVRLAVHDVREAGTVAGRLYAISTVGSIVGTFLPVLVLIPTIGTQRTMLLASLALVAIAVAGLPRRTVGAPAAVAALVFLPIGGIKESSEGRLLFEGDSPYQFVQIVEQDDGDRILQRNEGWGVHSVFPKGGGLTGGYWDAFLTLPVLTGRPDGKLAVLGNAGGTVATMYESIWPRTRIDGVEIDPLVTKASRRHLAMDNPTLEVHTADARFWIRGTDERFDGMVIDAYRQPYLPFHLATKEFFEDTLARTNPGGVVALNVATPPNLTEVVDRLSETMATVFPVVHRYRYNEFNWIVIGHMDAAVAARAQERLRSATGPVAEVAGYLAGRQETVVVRHGPLTDDHVPIELLTDRALLAYLREGAPGAER